MVKHQSRYSIGVMERDTGIGRDTLRVWERRYGFPCPDRNQRGERVYSEYQLRHLQRLRRLMDLGYRPGKLLAMDAGALDELEASLTPSAESPRQADMEAILDAVGHADAGRLELLFRQAYARDGMQTFILDLVAPLLRAVGDAWAGCQLEVFQEHFLSVQLNRFINARLSVADASRKQPGILLATMPGESHGLGLLMVSGILSSLGMSAINLGTQVPLGQVSKAAEQFHSDIVGLSFSSAYPYRNIREPITELRRQLPESVEIWIGGEGVSRLRKLPPRVRKITDLATIPSLLRS